MDKKSKALLIIFVLAVILSVSITFYRYMYLGDITFFTDPDSVPGSFDIIKNFLKI